MNNVLAAYLYLHGFEDMTLETAQQIGECLEFFYDRVNEHITDESSAEDIQFWAYEAGKVHFASDLRFWFRAAYQVIMEADSGPRLGEFIKLRGVEEILEMIYNICNQDRYMINLVNFRRTIDNENSV